jgi:hypothetical protein
LAFSYWFDKPQFLTEGKLDAVLITPSLGVPNYSVIYINTATAIRNILDSAARGTFMSLTLGAATKLLDNMMVNYSEWHTERAPQGKKVNSVEETSSLSDKIDAIMLMLSNDRTHVDPNNVPLASLVAQEEHVDVNFIRNNNFNNSAYRNNFASNNYRAYPSTNGNGYGNSYGNSSNNTRGAPSELEVMLKDFIGNQTALTSLLRKSWAKLIFFLLKLIALLLLLMLNF